jgi:hypothetical protein
LYNTKFIEVTSGLKSGDQVLLAPPFDTQEKDLGGAIIADGEAPPPVSTNLPAAALVRTSEKNGRAAAFSDRMGEFSRSRTNAPDMVKRFDADGDGKLSESELAAMRQWAARHPGTNGPSRRSLVN